MSVLEGRCGVAVTAETTTQHNRSHHTLYKMISHTHTLTLTYYSLIACCCGMYSQYWICAGSPLQYSLHIWLHHNYDMHVRNNKRLFIFFSLSLSLYHKWMLKRKLQWQYHFLLLLLLAWVHISSVYRDRFRCIFFFCSVAGYILFFFIVNNGCGKLKWPPLLISHSILLLLFRPLNQFFILFCCCCCCCSLLSALIFSSQHKTKIGCEVRTLGQPNVWNLACRSGHSRAISDNNHIYNCAISIPHIILICGSIQ